jgi:hypothetical protein
VFSVKPLVNTETGAATRGRGGAGGAYSLVRSVGVTLTVSIAANRSSIRLGTSAILSTEVARPTGASGPICNGGTASLELP